MNSLTKLINGIYPPKEIRELKEEARDCEKKSLKITKSANFVFRYLPDTRDMLPPFMREAYHQSELREAKMWENRAIDIRNEIRNKGYSDKHLLKDMPESVKWGTILTTCLTEILFSAVGLVYLEETYNLSLNEKMGIAIGTSILSMIIGGYLAVKFDLDCNFFE